MAGALDSGHCAPGWAGKAEMKITVYYSEFDTWALNIIGADGKAIFAGIRDYKTKGTALAAAERLKRNMHRAKVVVL